MSPTLTPLKSPLRKKLALRETRGVGADNEENELVRLLMTIPLRDMGSPTPRTTNLEEPPEGKLPPPPLLVPDNVVRTLGQQPPKAACLRTPEHYARTLFNSLKVVTKQAGTLNKRLLEIAKNADNHALQVLMVHNSEASKRIAERYREAQRNSSKRYAMATLVTSNGQLQIEGFTPKIDVLDVSASAVILGRSFARRNEKCRPPYLSYAPYVSMARGMEVSPRGRPL